MSAPVPVFTGCVRVNAPACTSCGHRKRLVLDEALRFNAYVESFDEQRVEVTIRKRRSKRSIKQNKAWWGPVLSQIAEGLGYDAHEHEMLHYELVKLWGGTHRDDRLGGV